MKLITRDIGYAVRALCFIAKRKGKIVTVAELVACLKIPRAFLRKLLQILNRKKLLRSYKGKGGGFSLIVAPEKILLLDLLKIFQGPVKIIDCSFKKKPCSYIKTCRLKKRVDKIERYMVAELKDITLASLLEKKGHKGDD